MKTIIISILIILVASLQVFAQPCTDTDRLKQKGYWYTDTGESTTGLLPTDVAKQKQITLSIIETIKNNYTPRGLDIGYKGVYYNNSLLPDHVNPSYRYYARFYFYKHPCGPYKRSDNPGFSSSLQININDFGFSFGRTFFVPSSPNEENTFADSFALIEQKPILKDGAWYWKSGDGNYTSVDYFWVIARPNQVPFVLVSRKEFAQQLKVYFEKKLKAVEAEYLQTIQSGEEAYHNVKKINENEAAKFREQNKLHAEQMRKIGKDIFGNSLRNVEDILSTSDASSLNQPAIVSHLHGFDEFNGFISENESYSMYVLKPNPTYFNTKLQKSTPQFITVHFKISEGEKELVSKTAKEEMFKAIDFNLLRTMLDK